MSPWRLAWLSLKRRRFPTVVALLAIALPTAAGGCLLRLNQLANARLRTLDRSFGIVVGAKTSSLGLLFGALNGAGDKPPLPLTANLYTTIRDDAVASFTSMAPHRHVYLRHLVPITVFARWQGRKVVGTDLSFWLRPPPLTAPELVLGRAPLGTGEVAMSASLAAEFGLRLGDKVDVTPWLAQDEALNAKLAPLSLELVGVVKDSGLFWDQTLVADLDQAYAVAKGLEGSNEFNPVWRERIVHYMLADPLPGGDLKLRDLINNATIGQAIATDEELAQLQVLAGGGARLGLMISGLVLVLGALAVTGIMVTRFEAMLGQLAVLRAIGYGRRELTAALVIEGLLLGGGAVCLGLVMDALGFPWLRRLSAVIVPLGAKDAVGLGASAPVWGMAMLATLVAVCLPLWRVYRQDVHRVLRSH